MTCQYSVSFEFETQPPKTYRGEVTGGSPATCMWRAMRAAKKDLKPVNWSSCVCVLLDRRPTAKVVTT